MTTQNIETRVKREIAEQLGMATADVQNAHNFANDLGADDLDLVELVMGIEDEFGVEVTDEEWEACLTVQQAIDLVSRKVG